MTNNCVMIGLCGTTMHKEPVRPIIAELARRIAKCDNYRLIVYHCFENLYYKTEANDGAATIFETINYDMLDIMVLMQFNEKQDELLAGIARKCVEHGVKVINIDRVLPDAFNINFGYGNAFSSIVEHLITGHGCKRIKIMAGMRNNEFSQTRIDSCREVMAEHGLVLADSDIMYGEFWDQPTYAEMDKFFASGEPLPDAFVCANDSMAMAVCLKLAQKNIRVPQDVYVTGFDGIELEKYHDPRLTTAIRDNNDIVDAVMNIINDINSTPDIRPYDTELSYTPVFSESCGCTADQSGNEVLADYVRTYTYAKDFEERMDVMCNKVSVNPTLENTRNTLRSYVFGGSVLCVTNDFYRCFSTTDEIDLTLGEEGYPKQMRVLIDGLNQDHHLEDVEFDRDEILPELFSCFGNNSILLLPLHAQENIIGYMATYIVPNDLYNDQLYSMNMSINRCLEMTRTHERLRNLNDRLEYLFTHDRLTNIYNRYGFYNNFKQQFVDSEGTDREVFIVSIDLNDMKSINDTFGHSAGDDALCITSRALTDACDGEDIICSRFGGDEFVVAHICKNAAAKGKCYHARFDEALSRLNDTSGYPYKVAASIGVYSASLADVDSIDSLIELADRLMYNDKARHKRRPKGIN